MCEAKISNRFPCPAEPVSVFSVVKPPDLRRLTRSTRRHGGTEGMRGWSTPITILNPMFECWNVGTTDYDGEITPDGTSLVGVVVIISIP